MSAATDLAAALLSALEEGLIAEDSEMFVTLEMDEADYAAIKGTEDVANIDDEVMVRSKRIYEAGDVSVWVGLAKDAEHRRAAHHVS